MAKDFTLVVSDRHFAEGKLVNRVDKADGLTDIIRANLVEQASVAVDTAAIAALIDSSGGSASEQWRVKESRVPFSVNDLTGQTTGIDPSNLLSVQGAFVNAYRELARKLNNALDAEFGSGVQSVDEGPGVGPNGTIELFDVTVANNTGNADASATVDVQNLANELLTIQRHLIHAIDDLRESVGLARQFTVGPGNLVPNTLDPDSMSFSAASNSVSRCAGVWSEDGFRVGDTIEIVGTEFNNGVAVVEELISSSQLKLTAASFTVVNESLDQAQTLAAFSIRTTRIGFFPDGFGLQKADWVPENAAGVAFSSAGITGFSAGDITKAALASEWDTFFTELRDNIAFASVHVNEISAVVPVQGRRAAMSR